MFIEIVNCHPFITFDHIYSFILSRATSGQAPMIQFALMVNIMLFMPVRVQALMVSPPLRAYYCTFRHLWRFKKAFKIFNEPNSGSILETWSLYIWIDLRRLQILLVLNIAIESSAITSGLKHRSSQCGNSGSDGMEYYALRSWMSGLHEAVGL